MNANHDDTPTGRITVEELQQLLDRGDVDNVLCAVPDPHGRLVGKRLTGRAFRDLGLGSEGVKASSFVFAVDLEMEPLELPVSNASNGYVDFRMVPDLDTLRRVPWDPTTALVLCDAYQSDSDDLLEVAPRSILKRQLDRAARHDLRFKFASELEFFLAKTTPGEAFRRGYQDLDMLSDYRCDYGMSQSSRDDWFIRQIRNGMDAFGVDTESSKPEWGLGQQEITLYYEDTLEMADRHVLFKYGVKDLANRAGLTPTFMAKVGIDEVGSSCHLHVSLWSASSGEPLCWDPEKSGMSSVFGSFVAGQLEHALDLGLMFAPTVNSYKRYQANQFAGTAVAVGHDNRSFAFRLVGEGASYRVENRIPGADVNPYYAYAATIAAGLAGIEQGLDTPRVDVGNAWEIPDVPTMWTSMHRAVDGFAESELAAEAFGAEVFAHLLGSARAEVVSFDSGTVTDWELRRYYERV